MPSLAQSLPSSSRLVNIGSHCLALYTHGAEPKNSSEPVVLFISGIGSDALNWQAVVRLLTRLKLRSYTYDRSGYNNSEISLNPPTAENIALELYLLIENTPIANPLILVGHSWAGVLIHEFIALKGTSQIAGVVLVDANHETAPLVMNVNDPILWERIADGVNVYAAWGVEDNHKLTKEEWMLSDEYSASFETLRKKELSKRQPLLDDKPVYVIAGTRSRDWSGLYKAGVAKGNGTEEERAYVRALIESVDGKSEGLQRKFLKLSTKSEIFFARESGHFVQLVQPEAVVQGVEWVLRNRAM
ncbi:Alpha/Beta hydrolase protein [Aspergillus filifer]